MTDYDYQKLIEQNPLSIIKLNELAPCLVVKLLSEPNRRIRNAESRERYAKRISDTIKTLAAEKEANERKDQIQALNLIDDILGPKDWAQWDV